MPVEAKELNNVVSAFALFHRLLEDARRAGRPTADGTSRQLLEDLSLSG